MERITFDGVEYTVVPGDFIDYHAAQYVIRHRHPLGNVYVLRGYGYIQSGYNWLRYKLHSHRGREGENA